MGKLKQVIGTASLDGFVAGPNDSPANPMGDSGMRLFDWYFSDSETSRSPEFIEPEIRDEATRAVGALVGGRRLYDNAHGWNGEHPLHMPLFFVASGPEVTGEWRAVTGLKGPSTALDWYFLSIRKEKPR